MTSVTTNIPSIDKVDAKFYNVKVEDSSNVHLGSEVQYYGPRKVHQYVTGLPDDLASRPEVGHGLAKAGLIAATSPMNPGDPLVPQSMTLLLPRSNKHSRWWWVAGATIIILLVTLITIPLVLVSKDRAWISDGHGVTTPSEEIREPLPLPDGNVTLSNKLRIIERREWLGLAKNQTRLISKARFIVVMETGGDTCVTDAICKLQVKNSQEIDLYRLHLDDIASNFLIGGTGYAYEGRNWDAVNQCSGNSTFDSNSLCIACIGEFSKQRPLDIQLKAAKQLIEMAITLEYLEEDYTVLAVRQINPETDNPGKALYDLIKALPRWKATLE